MRNQPAQRRLVSAIRKIAAARRRELEDLKRGRSGFKRPDFLWYYLLQSFATMGRASGAKGMKREYHRVSYDALLKLAPAKRKKVVHEVCQDAKIRMPDKKARYILDCFDHVKRMGGPESARKLLVARRGKEAKMRFLDEFPGIGPKYARNIMMDVYHRDFRDSIALDARIKSISRLLGLKFTDAEYLAHEAFYIEVARMAGLNGWELDRLLFNFGDDVKTAINYGAVMPTRRAGEFLDGGPQTKTKKAKRPSR